MSLSFTTRIDTLLALQSPNCSISATPLQCRLAEFLHLLYGAAAILGLVLVIVLILAIRTYRKNKNEDIQK